MAFVPRSTAPTGTALYTYWTSFTGECVWYSIGRIREVAGTPITSPNRAWPVTLPSIEKAKQIYPNADETNGWIKDGTRPSLGAIACWTGVDGHCMNVEAIVDDTIYLSGYNFPNYHSFSYLSYTLSEIVNGIPGLGAFQGFVRNPYVSPTPPTPGVRTPTISLSPLTGTITDSGIVLEITTDYIPYYEDNPEPLREMSSGLTRTWITPWQITTHTEDGNEYQRVYGVMRINADSTAPSSCYVRFYQNYYTGNVSVTGIYDVQISGSNIIPIIAKWLQKKRKKRFTIIRRI